MTHFNITMHNSSSLELYWIATRLEGAARPKAPDSIFATQVVPVTVDVDAGQSVSFVYGAAEVNGTPHEVTVVCTNPIIGPSHVSAWAYGVGVAILGVSVWPHDSPVVTVRIFDPHHSDIRQSIAAATWSPRRADVIGMHGVFGGLVHTWIEEPTEFPRQGADRLPGSHPFKSIPSRGEATRAVSMCAWSEGRLDLAVVKDRYGVTHLWWEGDDFHEEPLDFDGDPGSQVAIVSGSAASLDVILLDANGLVHRRPYAGRWLPWQSLGIQLEVAEPLCAASLGPNAFGVFSFYDSNIGVAERRVDTIGPSVSWPITVFTPTFAPNVFAACSWGPGRTDLFTAMSWDRMIEHRWRDHVDDPWSEPELLRAPGPVSSLAAATSAVGHLELFALCWGEVVRVPYLNGWAGKKERLGWSLVGYGYAPTWSW